MQVLLLLILFAVVYWFLNATPTPVIALRSATGEHWGMRPGLCGLLDKSKWIEYSQKWVKSPYAPAHAECWFKYCANESNTPVANDMCGQPRAQFTGCFEMDQSSGAENLISTQPGCMSRDPFS